jgi:hypothetical protein
VGVDGLQTIIPIVALLILAITFAVGYTIGVDKWS